MGVKNNDLSNLGYIQIKIHLGWVMLHKQHIITLNKCNHVFSTEL